MDPEEIIRGAIGATLLTIVAVLLGLALQSFVDGLDNGPFRTGGALIDLMLPTPEDIGLEHFKKVVWAVLGFFGGISTKRR